MCVAFGQTWRLLPESSTLVRLGNAESKQLQVLAFTHCQAKVVGGSRLPKAARLQDYSLPSEEQASSMRVHAWRAAFVT